MMPTEALWTTDAGWVPWVLGLAALGTVARWRLNPIRRRSSQTLPSPAGGLANGPGRKPPSGATAFWWMTLALLLVWNTLPFLFNGAPTVAKIPYSTFIEQVQQNNVAQVSIQGSEIAGKLKAPRVWNRSSGVLIRASSDSDQTPPSKTTTIPSNKTVTPGKETATKPPAPAKTAAGEQVQVSEFATVFPSSVGDPELLSKLEAHNVAIAAVPNSEPFTARIIGGLLPTALLVGFFWWMGRRAMQQQQSIFGAGRSQARRFVREETPAVTFADVAGVDAAKGQLHEIVSILKSPERYRALGARTPRGVLLAGPPGTGKTLLARAVAGEAQVPFFSISGSEFVEMFVGVGASRVRNMFQEVKAAAPAILFVDELDAIGRRRGAGLGMVNDEREQTLNQLLVEMDGFDVRMSVIVLAATNRPDVLDPALRRPGRFDREVVVGLPDRNGRRAILGIHTREIALAQDVDLDTFAAITMGMSGAQLANLCNEAALVAARDSHAKVERQDFETALDRIVLGEALPLTLDAESRRVVAYHESGHALIAWLTPAADPVHKVTIVPHGMALGVTAQRPEDDRYNLSRKYLQARLQVMLGGRGAEETVFDDVTTGAENDLVQATRQARRMVTAWGMSDLGLAAYESSSEDRFLGYELGQGRPYSEETARRIDAEVDRLLSESHATVLELLASARDRLDSLAQALLERETVGGDELVELLGPRPVK
jgi:cell division protease FtsH